MQPGDELLTIDQAAGRLKLSERTLYRKRKDPAFPKAALLGGKLYWRAAELDAWLDAQFEGASS